jgi:hypothetical protein
MCLQSIILESKRTLGVPERSISGFWHNGCHTNISWKLHINFQISTCLGSALSLKCPQNIIMESNGVIYYWQAYELEKAKALKVSE